MGNAIRNRKMKTCHLANLLPKEIQNTPGFGNIISLRMFFVTCWAKSKRFAIYNLISGTLSASPTTAAGLEQ